ncbi:hypothetical protein V8F06_013707, partial [Rhypophila decipiens]
TVWIEGLRPNITLRDLLDSIANFGSIFTSNVSNSHSQPGRPRPTAGTHLVFFTVAGARRFWRHAVRDHVSLVHGNQARVMSN